MNIGAVVVRWKGGDEVDRCIRSLSSPITGISTEIVLVDAGSGDHGAQRLAETFPDIRVEPLTENPGFAGAANHGVRVTDADYILLLNPDAEVQGQALSLLAHHLETRPDLAAAVPLLENPDGSSQHIWQLKNLPTSRDLCLGRSGRPASVRCPVNAMSIAQPAAAAWMIRREVWNALNGFDQAFFPAWWEDVDFCARLHSRLEDPSFPWNKPFQVVPDARVRHIGGSSVSSLGNTAFIEVFYRNLLMFAERHHPDELQKIRYWLRRTLMAKGLFKPTRFRTYREMVKKIGLSPS